METNRDIIDNNREYLENSISDIIKDTMLKEYTIENGDNLKLTTDKTFSSPSTAADFCVGSSNNGWLVWKDKDGQTLDAVYRKQLE